MKKLFLFLFVVASSSVFANEMSFSTAENCKLKVTELSKVLETKKIHTDGVALSFKDCALKECFLLERKTMYPLLEEFLKSASGKKLTVTTSNMEGKRDSKTKKIYLNDCYKIKIDGTDKTYINENIDNINKK